MSDYQNSIARPSLSHLGLVGLFAVLSIFAAFQLRLREDLANTPDWKLSGFRNVENEGEHKFRWTNGNGTIVFPDIGLVEKIRLKIKARAWRTETVVYSATVTANGLPVGIIGAAGWRDWSMVISDPTILGADRLVIGFQSTPFRFSELYSDSDDERVLGVSVESVQIEPQSNFNLGFLNHLAFPPPGRLALAIILGIGMYLFACALGTRSHDALYHALVSVTIFAFQLAFFGHIAVPPVLILGGVAGFIILARIFPMTPTTVTIGLIPFFLIPLFANAYLGFFSRFYFDDFCNVGYAITHGLLSFLYHYFFYVEGRYSLFVSLAFASLVGQNLVPLLPLFVSMLWFVVTVWTIFQLKKFFNLNFSTAEPVLFGSMLLCGILALVPNLVEVLFWETGMLTYLFPFVPLTFLTGLIARAAISTAPSRVPFLLIGCAGLSWFAAGFNETFAMMQITIFSLALTWCLIAHTFPGKRTLLALLIASLAGALLGILMMIFSPGNAARQAVMINWGYAPAERPDWLVVIGLSIQFTLDFVRALVVDAPILSVIFFATILAAMLVAIDRQPVDERRSLKKTVMKSGLSLGAGFCLVIVCFAPSAYVTAVPPPERALIVPLFVIVCLVALEGYLIGSDAQVAGVLRRVGKLSSFNTLLILVILIAVGPGTFSQRTLEKIPSARAFADAWDERDAELRSAKENGSKNVAVAQFEYTPYGHDIGPDPRSPINTCTAVYYGLDAITRQ